MGSITLLVSLAYQRFQSPSHLLKFIFLSKDHGNVQSTVYSLVPVLKLCLKWIFFFIVNFVPKLFCAFIKCVVHLLFGNVSVLSIWVTAFTQGRQKVVQRWRHIRTKVSCANEQDKTNQNHFFLASACWLVLIWLENKILNSFLNNLPMDRFQVVGGNGVFYCPPMPTSNWLCMCCHGRQPYLKGVHNRTIRLGTAVSAQKKMAKAATP